MLSGDGGGGEGGSDGGGGDNGGGEGGGEARPLSALYRVGPTGEREWGGSRLGLANPNPGPSPKPKPNPNQASASGSWPASMHARISRRRLTTTVAAAEVATQATVQSV